MKPIVPIVGISKIIAPYDAVITGFDGVLTKGGEFFEESLDALKKIKALGKDIVLLSNTPLRIYEIVARFEAAGFDVRNFKAVMTAGEMAHFMLKSQKRLKNNYYNIGGADASGIFKGLNYQKVSDINKADFVFIAYADPSKEVIEDYIPRLQEALALNLEMFCVGTDVARHITGQVAIGVGHIAEQYAAMGGKIITIGKADPKVLNYIQETLSPSLKNILFIGDSFTSDMKCASMMKTDMLFVSKGVHMSALGEGYIPDVQKTRLLAMNHGVYPDYVISSLRF